MNTADYNEQFTDLLSSLDEEYYYFIASNILGRIPSPFNKQTLNRSLLSFFLNPANLQALISSISEEEKAVLVICYLLDGANETQISAFLPSHAYYVLSVKLENLCDRLILFKTKDSYVINPLLTSFVKELMKEKRTETAIRDDVPFADSNVARAIFNLLINGSVPQREANIHHFIKSGKLETIFPQFEKEQAVSIFDIYRNLALKTKAIERDKDHTVLHFGKCKRIVGKKPVDLNLVALEVKFDSKASLAVAKTLAVLRVYPTRPDMAIKFMASLIPDQDVKAIFDAAKALGMLYIDNDTAFFNEPILNPAIEMSPLTISSDLTVSYYGTPQASDILFIFSTIQTCDKLVVYSITKDSFSRGLDLGLTKDRIEKYLDNSFVNTAFDQWEKAVTRIKLFDGIALQCTPEVEVLVKGIPEISDQIMLQLAPNLFLMRRSTIDSWGKALANAVDMESLPAPITEHQNNFEDDFFFTATIDFQSKFKTDSLSEGELESPSSDSALDWDTTRNNLLADAQKKGCLSEELEDLINSKLVFSPSQIGKGIKYYKLPSASGFDYNAKLSLIKKAIGSKPRILRLELTDENLVVLPMEIVKNPNGKAILKAKVIPTGEERNISIGTIFKVSVTRSV